jgi:pimeloyl-ACP methyl ester carboxylesterase
VDDVGRYKDDPGLLPFDTSYRHELQLRSPGHWLDSIKSPVFVFEGEDDDDGEGHIDCLRNMARSTRNPNVQFYPVRGADHVSILNPINRWIARKVLRDDGAQTNLAFSEGELNQQIGR